MARLYRLLGEQAGGSQQEELELEEDPQAAAAARLRDEVKNYRQDCWSRFVDGFWAVGRCVGHVKAVAFSYPTVAALMTALGRLAFLADYASDIQVGMQLRAAGNPIWGTIVLALVLVPYACMTGALADYAAERMNARCHIPRLLAKAMWLIAAFPVLLVTDVALTLVYFCRIPANTELFHYLNLRKMAELTESVPQLFLQTYIYVRLANPWRVFHSVSGASVDWRVLLASIGFSAYNLIEIYLFLMKFARVQGHGSKIRFLRMMSRLGEGLAPSILYEALEKQTSVTIDFDLAGISPSELSALGQTAMASAVLEELHFSHVGFLRENNPMDCENMIEATLNSRNLVKLSLGAGVQQEIYEEHIRPTVEEVFEQGHPKLRLVAVEGFGELRSQDSSVASSSTPDELLEAARAGDVATAQGSVARASLEELRQALAVCIGHGHSEVLRTLLSHPSSDPKVVANQAVDAREVRPLHMAARWRQPAAAGLLLTARADPDAKDHHGKSTVWEAAGNNSKEVLKLLLAARGDPDLQDNEGGSPVAIAAQTNAAEAVQQLLAARGSPNLQVHDGRSPVFVAAQTNSTEALEQLLASRGDPNLQANNGMSPVYMAAQENAKEALQLLLTNRGDPNRREENGQSPVHGAAFKNATEAMQLLLTANGNPNLTNEDGHTPIHAAAYSNSTEALEQLLVARGEPSIRDHEGQTPMDLARSANATEALALLQRNA